MERAKTQSEGLTWGVPAGKMEAGEMPQQAAMRELFEETHIRISPSQIKAIGKLYVQKPNIAYIYHMFQVRLSNIPEITLSSEHTRYLWATPQELEQLPLIGGAKEALQYFHQKKTLL
jgi:8-oxo-dGTP pyrophosphatase MutT (NUDIX family)